MAKKNIETKSVVGRKVSMVEMGSPVEGIGNKKTVTTRMADMVVVFEGVLAISKATGDEVLFPNANLKLCKLIAETTE